jgi:hypothetical protein
MLYPVELQARNGLEFKVFFAFHHFRSTILDTTEDTWNPGKSGQPL